MTNQRPGSRPSNCPITQCHKNRHRFHDVSLQMMIHEDFLRWILVISVSSHRELSLWAELQIIVRWVKCWCYITHLSPHKIFPNICPAPDHVYQSCLPWEGAKSYKCASPNNCGEERRVSVVCCYSFYRNKCFVSSEYGRESSLSGRLYLYGTLTSQAFITLEDARRYQVKNGDSGSILFHQTSLQSECETRYNCHIFRLDTGFKLEWDLSKLKQLRF